MIVFERERLGEWARARIPGIRSWGDWYQAIGKEVNGKIVAAVIYNHYDFEHSIAMHVAAENGWFSKDFMAAVFAYPFEQLGCERVTGYVAANKRRELRFFEALGFVREGLMRKGLPDDDLVILGLLRKDYGKEFKSAACA